MRIYLKKKINMTNYNIDISKEKQFAEVIGIIQQHKCRASVAVNNETLLTAWSVGKYVSDKLKSQEWGSKVVSNLSEYIRIKRPDIKGFSRSSIYNMVMFYDEYSSEAFTMAIAKYLNDEFVQSLTGQMPKLLTLTTLTNHIEILCQCKSIEERIFYILYAHKEHFTSRELQRCISNQTFSGLLGSKTNLSKGLLETYPTSPIMFKDTYFVDFLNLPKKHSESYETIHS